MQLVRVIYNSTEVTLSSFILLFFRMVGVFTYEQYPNEEQENLLGVLQELHQSEGPMPEVEKDIDLTIRLLDRQEEWNSIGHKEDKTVYVANGDWISKADIIFDFSSLMQWDNQNNLSSLLQLIDKMAEIQVIHLAETEVLKEIAKVFCEMEIFRLLFSTKYFFVAENDDDYNLIENQFQSIIGCLLELLRKKNTEWGDVDSLYLQHALLYMVYEADFYSSRNNKPFLYTVESLIDCCEAVLRNNEVEDVEDVEDALGTSMSLLLGQIYDDLENNLNKSFKNYIRACNDYSSYAYYRKACQYVNRQEHKIDKAISYFAKAIEIYPWFYRAWHMLGICFSKKKEWEKAIRSYEQVNVILANRKKANTVRLVEIEYSFRACNQIGQLYLNRINDLNRAMQAFKGAWEIWNLIGSTNFTELVWTNEAERVKIVERMKKELNIDRISNAVSEIIQRMKDSKTKMEK